MTVQEWDQTLRDGIKLHMYQWKPKNLKNVKGVVQLVHGSAEHAKRYDDFANYLVENDYIVIADDHRGHGKTAQSKEDLGFFAEEDGWEKIIDDLYEVTSYIKKAYPNQPIVIFGHSMGSFMVRHYLIKYGANIKAAVICGTAFHKKLLLKLSIKIAKHNQKKLGSKAKDQKIYNLSYAKFGKRFKDEGKTGTEWLSTDKKVQKAFQDDPLSGQVFSTSAFKDMFTGLLFINNKKNIQKAPKDLPILLISGQDDPVGNFGKGVKKVYKLFKKHHTNVNIKLYRNARHEILNEPIKTEVYQDILNFYNKSLSESKKLT
ncbi:Monoacylglycerol lipase [Spiroplasma sp. JKS002669]|uniref:alpha/beta fold hydrolase n=1 Tax=Spiroplasma attinicola TaxID=2904537 RepID=UPI0020BE6977|nr:alpha/beta hydrolase [Spiroplasma sp. JKS002669]MCL6428985.1 Monoacylglycerol lipase [Spiroplasma sp. JKS002669]